MSITEALSPVDASPTGVVFELQEAPLAHEESVEPRKLAFRPSSPRKPAPALAIGENARMIWARVLSPHQGEPLAIIPARERGALGFQVLRSRFSAVLGMRSLRDDVLVNGMPGLRFTILSAQDTILLADARRMFYVNEYFRPYVGPPPEEVMRDKRCPHCCDRFESATRVISCFCGDFYHFETAESHPHIAEEDRLDCMQRARICNRCRHELTTEGYRVWDPVSL